MKIKEFKLISKENNGTFPQLKCIAEHEVIYDDVYLNFYNENYEFEYMFFGDSLKLQNNYVEHYYVMSYDELDNPIGFIQISSGSRTETAIPFDTMFSFLLLTGSKSFITIHNHPNNNSKKSCEDILSDNSIKSLSEMLSINYKDGLIITKEIMNKLHEKMYSFMKEMLEENDMMSYEEWIEMEDM